MRHEWMLAGFTSLAMASSVVADLQIEGLPANAPTGFNQFFTKYVDVMGVGVYATSGTPNTKVLRCAHVLAQYIDNDEDGVPDNQAIHARMIAGKSAMIMWPTFDSFENSGFWDSVPESSTRNKQDCIGEETEPDWEQTQVFDAALEECFHLVNHAGYSQQYPSVFGEQTGSQVANAMDINIANGYFHYDDPTCDYPCKVIEYTYWAMTSILGAQQAPWRASEIANEWELPTRKMVAANDPTIYSILTDSNWGLPTVLPDGDYDPGDFGSDCPGDLNGDGRVDSADIGLMLAAWSTADPAADLDGDGVVGGGDLGSLLGSWGLCPVDLCAGADCNDGDSCTIDYCDPTTGACVHEEISGCGDDGGGDGGGECGDPGAGACDVAHAGPGCSNGSCCESVCAEDGFCCEEEWDLWCVVAAHDICGIGDPPDLDCCSPHEFPACIDGECEEMVCEMNEACCEDSWDEACAELAQDHCNCNP